MLGAVALLIRILSNPFSNLFQKKLGGYGANSLFISFFSYFILTVLCLIPAFNVNWAGFGLEFWQIVLSAGIIGALGNWFLVEAIKCGELSVLGPINTYKSVVSVIFAFILLHEIPSLFQFAGIFFIVVGSYFIFDTVEQKFTFALFKRRDIRFRFFALALTALEAVLIKKIVLLCGISTAFILWCSFSALFSFLILLIKRQNLKYEFSLVNPKSLKLYLALATTLFLMQFFTNIVFEKMNVSCALALFQLSSLISVFLGWRYFKEKEIKKKVLGTLIMIFGSCVIILT